VAPPVDKVASDAEIPAATAVVVIGGGIVGACTAFFLARRGVPVVLCEKGEIGAEQSSRNWGWVRKMGRDPLEIPLAIEALRLWPEMNTLVGSETGFRRTGIVYLCRTQKEMDHRTAWLEQAGQPFGLDSRLITRDQMARTLPGLSGPWTGGLFTPSDGRAEPALAAPAIAKGARAAGATILTQCAVRGIETNGGAISAVVTEKGTIACQAVVLAGGAWSRLFCRPLGVSLPQLQMLSSVLRTEPLAGAPETAAGGDGFAMRKRLDGGYTVASWNGNVMDIVPDTLRFARHYMPAARQRLGSIKPSLGSAFIRELVAARSWKLDRPSPFERTRILDPRPNAGFLRRARTRLIDAFPVFHAMRVAETWGGMIDIMPDGLPVISGAGQVPGFYIATGFTGHGFGIAPAAGRLMCDLVLGERPVVDPAPFRYSRFTDGSRPRPSPLV
jgi:glycine/D-amino acid oxidase-like deaminating enzyme